MNDTLLMAIGLMLIIEGLMPLLLPQAWRETFQRLLTMKNGQLRFMGLASVVIGLLLFSLAR